MLYPDESYQIMGACFEVHNRLGAGFLEPVYQEALAVELAHQSIPFRSQPPINIRYRDQPLQQSYVADFICHEKILVEIKATEKLIERHHAQVLNYLNATKLELGILVNFGAHPKIEFQRFVVTK